MNVIEEVKCCRVGKTMKTDEKRELFYNVLTDEKLKASLLKEYDSDDLKLQHILEMKNDTNKACVVLSMKEESKVAQALANLKDPNLLSNLLVIQIKDKELQQQVRLSYVPGYKQLLENFSEKKDTDLLEYFEPTIDKDEKLGIELEVSGENAGLVRTTPLPNGWMTDTERSVKNGVEIKTPPMFYEKERINEIVYICNFIHENDLKATEECGCHIHNDSEILKTPKVLDMYLYLYQNCERILYLISNKAGTLPRKRIRIFAKATSSLLQELQQKRNIDQKVENGFVSGMMNIKNEEELNEVLTALKDLQKQAARKGQIEDRDFGLNTLNVNREKNTIEYRMGNGADESLEVLLLATLFAALSSTAKRLATKELTDIEKHLLMAIQSENEEIQFRALMSLLFTNPKLKEQFERRYTINSYLASITENPLDDLKFATRGGGN